MEGKNNKKLLSFFIIGIVLIGLLILVLVLISKLEVSEELQEDQDLELNEESIKVLLKQRESLEKSIQITNNGESTESVLMSVENLEGMVFLDENDFSLRPGETKNLDLSFVSGSESFTFEGGVYPGNLKFQYGGGEVILPIVVEIESEEVLFDVNLDFSVIDDVVLAEVYVYNFGDLDGASVDVTYFISSMDGVQLMSEKEEVVVQTQAFVSKSISLSEELDEGLYVFYVLTEYGDSIGTASYTFVLSEEANLLFWILVVILAVLVISIGVYIYLFLMAFSKKKDKKKIVKKKIIKKKVVVKKKKSNFSFVGLFFKKSTGKPVVIKEKKPSFLGRWFKGVQKKKKQREKEMKRTTLEKKKEKKRIEFEKKRQEIQNKKLMERDNKKVEREEKKWKKERGKMIHEAKKLETKFKANKFKERVEKQKAIMPGPTPIKIVDPKVKMDQLIRSCNIQIRNENFSMAESFYEQTKPIYARLDEFNKRKYYDLLVELQSKIAMLQMSELRKTLLPKKRKR